MLKKTVDDLKNLQGRRVLVRCDFNVPLKDGKITMPAAVLRNNNCLPGNGEFPHCLHKSNPENRRP